MNTPKSRSKIKVCLVTQSLSGGGAERSCALLSQMLFNLGFSVYIVSLNNEIEFDYKGELLNLGVFKVTPDTPLQRFNRIRKIKKFLQKKEIDFVIDHRPKTEFYREVFYAKYIYSGVKKIYVYHSAHTPLYLTQKPKKFAQLCTSNFKNIAVSQYIKEEVLDAFGFSNTETIYNPFVLELSIQDKLPSILEDKTYILSYGRMEDDVKDFKFLLKAYSESKLPDNNVYLVLMGDGSDKEMLLDQAQKEKAAAHIIFLPFTSNPYPVLNNSKIVTLTSNYEGFPMVLVEALAHKVPVVSLDIVSGPSEIIVHKENGLLVKERNVASFAEALNTLYLDTSLYNRCVENAIPSISFLNHEGIANQWKNILIHE